MMMMMMMVVVVMGVGVGMGTMMMMMIVVIIMMVGGGWWVLRAGSWVRGGAGWCGVVRGGGDGLVHSCQKSQSHA